MIKKGVKYLVSTFGIGLLYCLGFLALRETHPFSRFPMYNSFLNWAYVFYFSDENKELVPSQDFQIDAADLSHFYYSYAGANEILYGFYSESDKELQNIGSAMMENLIKIRNQDQYPIQQLSFHRLGFYYENDSIRKVDKIIYEAK